MTVSASGSRWRPVCRACLDWSVRRHHLAGALGAALLERIYERGWAKRKGASRVIEFSRAGETALQRAFAMIEATEQFG